MHVAFTDKRKWYNISKAEL